jgi:hypothetical protein
LRDVGQDASIDTVTSYRGFPILPDRGHRRSSGDSTASDVVATDINRLDLTDAFTCVDVVLNVSGEIWIQVAVFDDAGRWIVDDEHFAWGKVS